MKIDLSSKYISSSSYAKKQTIPIDISTDPRLTSITSNFKIARTNAEYVPIGDGKNLAGYLLTLRNQSLYSYDNPNGKDNPGSGRSRGIPELGTPPLQVENLQATWGANDSIILTFDFDTSLDENQFIDKIKVKLRDSVVNKYYSLKSGIGYEALEVLDFGSISQTVEIPWKDWSLLGIRNIDAIDQVGVATADILQTGDYVYADLAPYVPSYPVPEFTLTAGIDFYAVDILNMQAAKAAGDLLGIIVEEYVTTEMTKANIPQPTSMTNGWVQAYTLTLTEALVIFAPDEAHRWVRVKYLYASGKASYYTDIKDITPLPFQPTNTNPPTQFTAASIAWQGNDIKVNFTQPSSNSGNTIKVKLVPYVNGVESTSLYAHYYHVIVSGETSFTIPSLDLYGQFGTYYSTFKAYITSVSAQGVETTGAVITSGPISRTNAIANIYPTLGTPNVNSPTGVFRVTSISNGYVVEFDLPAGATRLEVYEKSSAWTTIPTDDSNMIYSGLSPATIITPDNSSRYVIVRYYDQYGGYSYYSMEKSGQTSGSLVTPTDIGLNSLINNPIKISTDGSIFSGAGGSTVYPQVFFNKDGLFAYDSSGNWTTEIINSATSGAPTFITKRAVIADWTIAPTAIENTGYASGSTYTGLSASGTYAFWAGAISSKNTDGLANFSVTPAGQVVAKKITINGDGTGGDLIRAGGSKFIVNQNGDLTATSATLTGSLTVTQQSYFQSNVNVTSGYIIAGSGGPNSGPNVQIDSTGLSARSSSEVNTKIFATPFSYKGTEGITFWTRKALLGSDTAHGWLIDDDVIKSDYINLDSSNNIIKIYSTSNSAYGVQLSAASTSDKAILVGNLSNPAFYVNHDGFMKATNAEISGTITASTVDISGYGTNVWNSSTFTVDATSLSGGIITLKAAQITDYSDDYSSGDTENDLSNIVYSETVMSSIVLNNNGVSIQNIPSLRGVTSQGLPLTSPNSNNYQYKMGKAARQRMLVMDPYDKKVYRGLAVYYGARSSTPGAGTGHTGDLWVSWA